MWFKIMSLHINTQTLILSKWKSVAGKAVEVYKQSGFKECVS